jgi:hypothetical protein
MRRIVCSLLFAAAALVLGAGAASADTVTVAAAGDIARASFGTPQQQTADLIAAFAPTAVFALGDTQYPDGALSDFRTYYDDSWGAFKSRTYPIPGNHEYQTPGASGFFSYFGTGAAVPISSPGYYSLNLGDWHIVFLNTICASIDCSTEKAWLATDLRNDTSTCDMVVYHNTNLKWPRVKAQNFGVDVALAASRHVYERWPAQSGLVRFTVGTGGNSLGKLSTGFDAGVRAYGVIQMTLTADAYSWAFVDVTGAVRDAGSRSCA